MTDRVKRVELLLEIEMELDRARAKHIKFPSTHHGYAVLAEEVDELWDHVRLKEPDTSQMRRECIQIAAMAIRFIEDVCEGR